MQGPLLPPPSAPCWRPGYLAGSKTRFLLLQEARAGVIRPSLCSGWFLPLPACFELQTAQERCPLKEPALLSPGSGSQTLHHLKSSPCLQRLIGWADFQVESFVHKWVSKRVGRRQALTKTKIHLPSSCNWARSLTVRKR